MLLTMLIVALAPRLAGVFADRWLALSDTPWPRDVSIVVPNSSIANASTFNRAGEHVHHHIAAKR